MDGLSWNEHAPDTAAKAAPSQLGLASARRPSTDLLTFAASAMARVEDTLGHALACAEDEGCPPKLSEALRYTLFPRRGAHPPATGARRRLGLRRR